MRTTACERPPGALPKDSRPDQGSAAGSAGDRDGYLRHAALRRGGSSRRRCRPKCPRRKLVPELFKPRPLRPRLHPQGMSQTEFEILAARLIEDAAMPLTRTAILTRLAELGKSFGGRRRREKCRDEALARSPEICKHPWGWLLATGIARSRLLGTCLKGLRRNRITTLIFRKSRQRARLSWRRRKMNARGKLRSGYSVYVKP